LPVYDAPVRLLRLRDFRLLVVSNGLSSFGDELALIALTIKVFKLSGSGISVSAVLLAGILPMVVFAPLAGLIVDRTETTGTLAIASAVQAAIAAALAFAQPVWLIVALSFLLGSVASVASPAVFAIVPKVVGEEDLTEANANMETARYIGMVLGPLVAGALAGAGSREGEVALVVDALTFLAICWAAASLRARRPPEPEPDAGRPKGEARQGFAFIARDRVLLIAVVAIAATVLFAAMDNVAEVFFAENPGLLNAGNMGYGLLASAWLLGMVAGAALIARRLPEDRLAPAILLASIIGGGAVAVAAGFPAVGLALAMFALGGVANGVESVSMRSLIHHRVPDHLRGRVFAAYYGLAMAGQMAATVIGGLLVAGLGAQLVLLIGGLGGAAVGLIGLAWFATLPIARREPAVVVVPEPEPEEPSEVVLVRDITPADGEAADAMELGADDRAEVLPSAGPPA
jgi:MFS family permease